MLPVLLSSPYLRYKHTKPENPWLAPSHSWTKTKAHVVLTQARKNLIFSIMEKNNINVTLRRELGSDISASCGQLKIHYLEEGGLDEV